MDAPDEQDLVLQRSSSDLLLQFNLSLPKFLWSVTVQRDGTPIEKRHIKGIVRTSTTADLVKLLEPFQEWPQLLDADLVAILAPLVDAFVLSLTGPLETYFLCPSRLLSTTLPLPRAVCRLLYTLCKIRGPKVISRFFRNEPMYIELMLNALHAWNSPSADTPESNESSHSKMAWEEKYIMLLWLAHLMLTPFALASIQTEAPISLVSIPSDLDLDLELPTICKRILAVGLQHLLSSGKEREAAVTLMVRLVLRPDMAKFNLLGTLLTWAMLSLRTNSIGTLTDSIYRHIGALSFLASTVKSADAMVVVPFLLPIFQCMQVINARDTSIAKNISSSAIAHKAIIKAFRSVAVTALRLEAMKDLNIPDVADAVLEEIIQHLLGELAHKDTPVRFAASKALSVITLSLKPSMANEIVQALIATLEENILSVDAAKVTNCLSLEGDRIAGTSTTQRDLAAVNALQWQGLILTLSHLLFRRSPSPRQLPLILNALVMALGFEQRSSSGISSGISVRDAACFGIWSLARRYTTSELLDVDTSVVQVVKTIDGSVSILQIVADELVVTAATDPSGNIRRGASAALQELIGRHPDQVIKGISLVQLVDYHMVALRSKALLEVATSVTALDQHYWDIIFDALLSWRAIDSTDANARRLAAQAIGLLSIQHGVHILRTTARRVWFKLGSLQSREVEKRHGLLLAASAIILQARNLPLDNLEQDHHPMLPVFWEILIPGSILHDRDFTSSMLRPLLTAEGTCSLISALSSVPLTTSNASQSSSEIITTALHFIDLSLTHCDDLVITCASNAADMIFGIVSLRQRQQCVNQWLVKVSSKGSGSSQSSVAIVGLLAALGAVYHRCYDDNEIQGRIMSAIHNVLQGQTDIATKVGALKSLSQGILSYRGVSISQVTEAMLACLQDFTTDQRGDVGSLVRYEAITAVHQAWKYGCFEDENEKQSFVVLICSLAVEKLDKVRYRAWLCLQDILGTNAVLSLSMRFPDISQTSSVQYFLQLLPFLSLEWAREPFLEGLVTSVGVGSESILCASRAALASFIGQDSEEQLFMLWEVMTNVLRGSFNEQRLVVPILEAVAFLLDCGAWHHVIHQLDGQKLFLLIQKAHYKSGNPHRLKAAIDAYVGLSAFTSIRNGVLLKLASLLLHPMASIRNKAADALFIVDRHSKLEAVDWSRHPREIRAEARHIQDRYLSSA